MVIENGVIREIRTTFYSACTVSSHCLVNLPFPRYDELLVKIRKMQPVSLQ